MILEVRRGGGDGHGFFSNFFKVLSTMIVAREGTDKVIVDLNWNGVNIWDKMFLKIDEYTEEERTLNRFIIWDFYPTVNHIKTYSLKEYPYPLSEFGGYIFMTSNIYTNPHLNEIRKIYRSQIDKLRLTPEFEAYVNQHLEKIKSPDKTLAVFVRQQIHYFDLNDNYIQDVIKEIDSVIDNYENILLLTQVAGVIETFKEKYGDKLIYFENRPTLGLNQDWSQNPNLDLDKEFKDAYTDVYVASQCKLLLAGSSNMTLGALSFNPDLEFKIFDCLKRCNGK